jgi:HEAT repeat protein
MRSASQILVLGVLTIVSINAHAGPAPTSPSDPDEGMLRKAHIRTDNRGLLRYLSIASPSSARLRRLIEELGSDNFQKREEAVALLEEIGSAGESLLREAARSTDPEVARRARLCLRRIQQNRNPRLPEAAVRLLVRRHPAGVIKALISCLPAQTVGQEEEVVYGLYELTKKEGKIDPALMKALTDPQPSRRASSALIVGRWGEERQRAALRTLLSDAVPLVRLRTAQGLLAAHDLSGLPALVGLLTETDAALAWQAEELLHWAAGTTAPKPTVGAASPNERRRCQTAWREWLRSQAPHLNRSQLGVGVRRPELLLVHETFGSRNGLTSFYATLYGCDDTARWQLSLPDSNSQCWIFPGNRILTLGSEVIEHELSGKIVWRARQCANDCQRLADGTTVLMSQNDFLELDSAGRTMYSMQAAIRAHPSLNMCPPAAVLRRADSYPLAIEISRDGRAWLVDYDRTTGREIERMLIKQKAEDKLGLVENGGIVQVWPQELPNGNLFVPLKDQLIEVNRSGTIVRRLPFRHVGWGTRLRNGNTLIGVNRRTPCPRIVEVNRAGRIIWQKYPSTIYARFGIMRVYQELVSLGFEQPPLAPEEVESEEPGSVAQRLKGLRNKNAAARDRAASALGRMGEKAAPALPTLIDVWLHDPDLEVRLTAERALNAIGPAIVPTILPLLKDKSPAARAGALRVLSFWRIDSKLALAPLLQGFRDPDAQVRAEAARQSATSRSRGDPNRYDPHAMRYPPAKTVPALMVALHDRDDNVREKAVIALMYIGKPARPAAPALTKLVKDPKLGKWAQHALDSIKGK